MRKRNQYLSSTLIQLFKVIFVCCFVALFTPLFSFQQVFEVRNPTAEEAICDHYLHLSDTGSVNDHQTNHHPFVPCSTPLGQILDESTEDFDDEFSRLSGNLPFEYNEKRHSKERLFPHLRLFTESRSLVSLFILYHCWKSFLA
jgi:hypothetical protein